VLSLSDVFPATCAEPPAASEDTKPPDVPAAAVSSDDAGEPDSEPSASRLVRDDSVSLAGVVVSVVGVGDVAVVGGVGGVGGVGIDELRELQPAWPRAKPAVSATTRIKPVLSEIQARGSARSISSVKFISNTPRRTNYNSLQCKSGAIQHPLPAEVINVGLIISYTIIPSQSITSY
jgi:hypothetical protein